MKAVVLQSKGTYALNDVPMTQIRARDDVLVKIDVASICGTDVRIIGDLSGRYGAKPMILGHEAAGTVVETGEDITHVKPGDKVVLNPVLGCGTCFFCLRGQPHLCSALMVRGCRGDGYFCEYVVAKKTEVLKIASSVPPERAVFAEPLSCVLGAMKKLSVTPSDRVLVLGSGPIGLYFQMLLKHAGAGQVITSEVAPFRAEYAQKCGADVVIDPSKEDLFTRVLDYTDGIGVDLCVDAVGCLLPDAIQCTRKGGTILLFGQNNDARQTISQCDIVIKGLNVLGNIQGDHTFAGAVRLLEEGALPFETLITHRLPIDAFGQGIECMRSGNALEVVLTF